MGPSCRAWTELRVPLQAYQPLDDASKQPSIARCIASATALLPLPSPCHRTCARSSWQHHGSVSEHGKVLECCKPRPMAHQVAPMPAAVCSHQVPSQDHHIVQLDGLWCELAHLGARTGPGASGRPVPGGLRPGPRLVPVFTPDLRGCHWPCPLPPSGMDSPSMSVGPICATSK